MYKADVILYNDNKSADSSVSMSEAAEAPQTGGSTSTVQPCLTAYYCMNEKCDTN